MMILSGCFGVRIGGPVWPAAAVSAVLLLLYLLHDLGILNWKDDFRREVAMRSGLHALVAVGLVSAFIVATNNVAELLSRAPNRGGDAVYTAATTLRIAAIAWGMSWLIQFWGGRAGAIRILWLLLGISFLDTAVTLVRVQGTAVGAMSVFAKFAWYPLAALAIIGCRRWPRVGGAVLGLAVVGVTWYLARGMAGVGILEDTSIQIYMLGRAMLLWIPALALLSARRIRED
ncbi:hypothetical protein FJ250_10105 [bacterium]|nr:hypothetical protein [bacterium]